MNSLRDLSEELKSTDWIIEKCQKDSYYSQNLYAALCNIQWQPIELFPILKDERWSCSWRTAGAIVAELRGFGEDYLDYYCSGMTGSGPGDAMSSNGMVSEGTVTDEIANDLRRVGWQAVPWED